MREGKLPIKKRDLENNKFMCTRCMSAYKFSGMCGYYNSKKETPNIICNEYRDTSSKVYTKDGVLGIAIYDSTKKEEYFRAFDLDVLTEISIEMAHG